MSLEACSEYIKHIGFVRFAEPLPCKYGWEALNLRQNNCSRKYTSFLEIL